MKKLFALVLLALAVSTSAFATDAVGRGVKDAGKATSKVVTVTSKNTAKAGVHIVKFLF